MAAIVINVAGTYDDRAIKQAQKSLGKLSATASKESRGFSGSIGKMGVALKGLAAGVGVALVVNGLERLATAAQESAKVTAITAQALKTTGASAWTTSEQINALASSISAKTGIDDEQIQTASNLLLTFKNVQNAGAGQAAMFDRATKAATDLSVAGFGSLDSAAKMLGKALNDPTKGITALSRAGVTFTDQQKAQIAALQKSGDLLGAQAIIMGEVESQVGGAAEAAANPIGMLQKQLGDLAEAAGAGLLPALRSIAESLAPMFQQLQPVLTQLGTALGGVISQVVTALTPAIGPLIQVVGILVEALGGALGTVLPPLAEALAQVAVALAPIIAKAAKFVQVLVEALMPVLKPLLDALTPIIDALVAELSPILDLVISLVQTVAPIFAILAQVLATVLVPLSPMILVMTQLMMVVLEPLIALLQRAIPWVEKIAGAFTDWAETFRTQVVTLIGDGMAVMADKIGHFFSDILGRIPGIGGAFKDAGNAILGFASTLATAVSAAGSSATTSGEDVGRTLARSLAGGIGSGSKTIAEAAGQALKAALDAGQKALEKYQATAKKFSEVQKQIRDSIASSATDIKAAMPTAGMVGPSAEGIIANLQEKLAQVRKFSGLLSQVSALVAGTPGGDALVQQLIGAGPVDGAALAAALLEGGKSALSQIVGKKGGKGADAGLFGQINAAATTVGTIGASSATGLTAQQARAINQTEVKVEKGAVVVNFGAGITGADRQAITATVNTAVTKALAAAKAEAGRGK